MASKIGVSAAREEQFLLRFADPSLADRIRRALREEESLDEEGLQLRFPDSGRQGQITVDGIIHRVDLLDLPTVCESYKTLDDTNLVKTGDIGQVLLVGGEVVPGQTESRDGVTPPMQNARERHFKKLPTVDPQVVSRVEADLLSILQGGAPAGYEFHDVEEEYVVDPETNVGTWQLVKPAAVPTATVTQGEGEEGQVAAAEASAEGGRATAAADTTPGDKPRKTKKPKMPKVKPMTVL